MATIEQAYIKYKQKAEKNITNDGISTDKGRFVLSFNEAQNKYMEFHLQFRGADDIRYIEKFLVKDKRIPTSKTVEDHQDFIIPDNYFDKELVRAKGSKEKCKGENIDLFPVKMANLSEILQDENNMPSFKWREAPYTMGSNNISIYTGGDFKIDYLLLTYYRYPNQISQTDPEEPESQFNESVPIEWDDKSLDRIISLTVGEIDINDNNPRFQLQQLRAQK